MTNQITQALEALKFRKKPVVIEAVQYTEAVRDSHLFDGQPLPEGVEIPRKHLHPGDRRVYSADAYVQTLEGRMSVSIGDWIIKGVRGEFYPCKPDIFAATYEPALSSAAPSAAEPVALKDHEVREVISAVTKVAQQYGQTQQLRARIADVLLPVLKAATPAPQAASEPATDHVSLPRKALYRDVMQAKKQLDEFGFRASYLDWITNYATLPNGLTEAETSASKSVAGLSGDAEREALTDDPFLKGVCVALSCVHAVDVGTLWAEIVRTVGVDEMLNYAAHIEPEEWELAGFSQYAMQELGRRKPRKVRATHHSTGKPDELPLVAECPCCGTTLTREDIATADAPVAEPVAPVHGWVTMWPKPGSGRAEVYSHGEKKPSYGVELDALLSVYPVYTRPPATEEAKDAARLDFLQQRGATVDLVHMPVGGLLGFRIGGRNNAVSCILRDAIDAAMAQGDKQS